MTNATKPRPWSRCCNLEVNVIGRGSRDVPACQWTAPAPGLQLEDGQMHLWRASLDQPAACQANLVRVLSWDELNRAARFHFVVDQRRFMAGRGLLRLILWEYLDTDPAQIRFRYGRYGKPSLDHPEPGAALRFNLSHSEGRALYAVRRHADVGVDLERFRPVGDEDSIAREFCSDAENQTLQNTPASQRPRVFFEIWTRREAYLKALGHGLGGASPDSRRRFNDAPPTLSPNREEVGDSFAEAWVRSFTPFPDHVAAVATFFPAHCSHQAQP